MLNTATLPSAVARLAKSLPSFPAIVIQLLDMLRDESASFEVLTHLARNDPVISANILAQANHIRRIHSQSDLCDAAVAASIIGINRVRRIVVAAGMNHFVSNVPGGAFLFHHSLAVAIAAQELSVFSGQSQDLSYITGMLHDVGQLCLRMLDAQAFEKAYRDSALDDNLVQHEAAVFGVDHCQIGAQLARHWSLPDEICSAILNHHSEENMTCQLQACICVSETLARALDLPPSPKNRVTIVNHHALIGLELEWSDPGMVDVFDRCVARFHHATQH